MNDIFVVIEHKKQAVTDASFELLCFARSLTAPAGSKINAIILADKASELIEQTKTKADQIFFAENDKLAVFNADAYRQAIVKLLKQAPSSAILMTHNSSSLELAPSLVSMLNSTLVSDCINLQFTENNFIATRKIYEGKICSDVSYNNSQPIIATIQPGAYKIEESTLLDTQINKFEVELKDNEYKKIIEYIETKTCGIDISASPVIVSVGRGIRKEKNMALVKDLADALGAQLACSRPVVDKGWLPKDRQVGTSGKTVKPKLYLAVGISGSFQHTTGMKGAENIIAINKDPRAPIFEVAHYAIVDDLFKVVPRLTEKIKAVKM